MIPFINWPRSAGGRLVDEDLPAPTGDCALTAATRRKATTVSVDGNRELYIALGIMASPCRQSCTFLRYTDGHRCVRQFWVNAGGISVQAGSQSGARPVLRSPTQTHESHPSCGHRCLALKTVP